MGTMGARSLVVHQAQHSDQYCFAKQKKKPFGERKEKKLFFKEPKGEMIEMKLFFKESEGERKEMVLFLEGFERERKKRN
jgi:hypothetical protein